MNTIPDSGPSTKNQTAGRELAWLTEREYDIASWLDEIDLDLHEQLVCGSSPDCQEKIDSFATDRK